MQQSLTLLICSLTMPFALSTLASEAPVFHADVTQGNVRVVLMNVGQTTVFPNAKDNAGKAPPWHEREGKQGVPCFTITFLMEALGDTPLDAKLSGNIKLSSAGKPLELERVNKDHFGAYQQWFDYGVFQDFLDFTKPEVANPKRAFIMRYVRFGAVPNLQPLSLEIETGFNKDIKTFRFDPIRLR